MFVCVCACVCYMLVCVCVLVVAGAIAGSVAGFYRMWDLIRTPTGKQPRPRRETGEAGETADA